MEITKEQRETLVKIYEVVKEAFTKIVEILKEIGRKVVKFIDDNKYLLYRYYINCKAKRLYDLGIKPKSKQYTKFRRERILI